jgi:hypothetical protein
VAGRSVVMGARDDVVAQGPGGRDVESSLIGEEIVVELEVGKSGAKVRGYVTVNGLKCLDD